QAGGDLLLASAQGLDPKGLVVGDSPKARALTLPSVPAAGSWGATVSADILAEHGLSLNDEVRLISTRNARYTALGLTPTQRLFTITAYKQAPAGGALPSLTLALEDLRRLTRSRAGEVGLRLFLADPFAVDRVAAELRRRFGEGAVTSTWRAQAGEFFRAVAMERVSMQVMLFLVVVVAAFNILSALAMMVSARLREIAILKSLGLTDGRILGIFTLLGSGCGLIGTVAGVALGVAVALNSGPLLATLGLAPGGQRLPCEIEPLTVLCIALCSLALSALASLYPAYRASRCDPVTHLAVP
ncbi:MAG: FtsX-like permease family protein, partial [Succinivibrionaceae bacterium]|nr:FtsX-like permease family protein [Succinivibrionaceae bacterium]